MKRIGTGLLAAVFAVAMAQAAFACDKEAKGGCSKMMEAKVAAATSENGAVDQSVEQVMASLPKMTYRVGSMDTPCPNAARAAAEKTGEPIQYVVNGEAYSCHKTAMNKLAEQIQAELPQLAKVTHVVDGESLGCPKAAAKLAADHHSTVKHMVAGVSFDCPNQAQQVADSLAAKLASSHGCAKAFAEGCAKDGVAMGGCHKAAEAKAMTASATEHKSGCCGKKSAEAKVASAEKTGGCSKSKEAAAQTASADQQDDSAQTETADASAEETPQLANAKLLVREIVEYVAASRNS
ncbi:MAG TPA: hypothetical protein P5572_13360 [Phycisphaerae bacterium]|nr:hypothetical protein [Phycisphaerales bacterium]HRX86001.1 hypothetical protein [Phycisphaerae bacterium]